MLAGKITIARVEGFAAWRSQRCNADSFQRSGSATDGAYTVRSPPEQRLQLRFRGIAHTAVSDQTDAMAATGWRSVLNLPYAAFKQTS